MNTFFGSVIFRVAIIYSLGVLAAMTVGGAVPQLDAIAGEFHPESPSVIGLVMSLPSVMVVVGALLVGYLVDRFGDKLVLLIGSVALVIGDVVVVAAPTLQTLLVGRGISGVGYVLMAVSAITLLIRVTHEKQRHMAIAVWATFVPVSFIIPFLTAGWVVSAGSWRFAFWGHAVVTIAIALIAYVAVPARVKVSEQPSRTSGLQAVLRSPWPYLLGISIGGDAFLHVGVIATLAPYLQSHYGADPLVINSWNIGAMVLNALGCLLFGKLLNQGFSPIKVGVIAIIATGIPAFAIYALPIGVTGSIACSWVLMFFSGVLTGMWSFVPNVSPSAGSIGATSGLVTQLTLLGVLLSGPVSFGAMSGDLPISMQGVIVIALLACLARLPILARGIVPKWSDGATVAVAGH
ncbi:MFS transporter [Pseudomonas sp. 14P_8.1_Bac3]|uniref:MFS transporter n=1 Tax=Pseudomonas sp. 14P_8.1_Bac3 TaxID=2971621 RepID=UPI0021C82F89|nr:MFS transporter [Pseudomonas sp. 14P_8.1_Bac3]MCU1760915.1 MFS transporter [Pseudomonas sp. 14P_8.1_Bac3]